MRKFLRWAGIGIVVLLVLIQFIPVDRTNPAVTRAVNWNSPETEALARRACMDCHSNETVWPWYSYVAPMSLLVGNHVVEGRGKLNFSAWDQPNEEFEEVEKAVKEGFMPESSYLIMHSEAKLSDEEKTALIEGLRITFQNDPPIEREGPGRG